MSGSIDCHKQKKKQFILLVYTASVIFLQLVQSMENPVRRGRVVRHVVSYFDSPGDLNII